MLEEGRKKYIAWALFVILGIIWGSSFILMKKALFTANGDVLLYADEVALLRLVFAMFSLLPIALYNFKKLKRNYWKYLFVVGIFGNGIPAFLFTYAQTQVSSSLAGILNSTVPIFTLVLGTLFFAFKSSRINKIGVFIGFLGSAIIIIGGQLDLQFKSILYPGLILFATLCYAISTNTIKKYLHDIRAIEITAFGLLTVGIPATIYLSFSSIPDRIMIHPELIDGVLYTLILALASTSLALILFNYLIKMATALFASSVTYLIPLVAVLWGWVDGERLTALQVLGGFVLLIGVILIYRKEKSTRA
jgi:drug/metabolite transporter (DMT)-like permease